MIYFYEFLRGVGLALLLFGALYFFIAGGYSFIRLCFGALPGLFVFIVAILLIQNDELRRANEKNLPQN